MCGILYVKRNKAKANKTVIKRFHKQRLRGVQGFGYVTMSKGKVDGIKRFENEVKMIKSIKDEDSHEIMFHHRTPTGTPNISEMNHPILVDNDMLENRYYIIHNGIISNDLELKKEHEALGFKYTTEMIEETVYKTSKREVIKETEEKFNDSEVFAIDFALFLENHNDKIESKGSISFICIETDKKNKIQKIHYGHNEKNPLVIEENKDMFILKSEGNGKSVEVDVLYSLNYTSNELIEKNVNIGDDFRFFKGSSDNSCQEEYRGQNYYPEEKNKIGYGYEYYEDMESYYTSEKQNKRWEKFPELGENDGIIEAIDDLYERYSELESDLNEKKDDIGALKLQIDLGTYLNQEKESEIWLEEMNIELEDIIDEMKDINSRVQRNESTSK